MWQRFTERARRVVFFAQEEAGRLGENYVSTEHLLLGLVRENDSVAARVLDRMGVSLGRVRSEIERQVVRGDGRLGQDMRLTVRAKQVIDLAYDEAHQLNNNYIGTEHLLLGLIREGDGLAGRVLSQLGATLEDARGVVVAMQDTDSTIPVPAPAPPVSPDIGKQFAEAFAELPKEQQDALLGDGLALKELSAPVRTLLQMLAHRSVHRGACILDPNGPVRVNLVEVGGAQHYTVTASASMLLNFLAHEPDEQ